jgi:ParB family chromosome partitioning protein
MNKNMKKGEVQNMSEKTTKEEIVEIELNKLVKSPYNVRVELTAIGELAKNIQKDGLHNPIRIRPIEKGKYEIAEGNRRVEAFKTLGRKKIPAIIKDMSDQETMVSSLEENIQREDISPDERARAFAILLGRKELLSDKDAKLVLSKPMTEQSLADHLGITRQSINNGLEPLRQAKETRQLVHDGRIGEDQARNIRQLVPDDSKKEVALAKAVANAELTQTETRDLLQKARQKNQTADEVIKQLKGEDKIKDEEITSRLTDAVNNADVSEKKHSLVDTKISRDDIKLNGDIEGETLTVNINDEKLVKALNKYVDENNETIEDTVKTALRDYLKKEGYIKK